MTPAARLTWRFALLPAMAVVAMTAIMLGVGYRLLAQELTERALASNQHIASALALDLQLSLKDAVTEVRLLARSPLLEPGAGATRTRAELDHLVRDAPRFIWAGLLDPDGRVLAGSQGWLEGQSLAERPVFQKGRAGMVGDVHRAVALAPLLATLPGGAPELIDIGQPVLDDDGRVTAVLAAHLGLAWVMEQMRQNLHSAEGADHAGRQALVLTGPDARSVVPGLVAPAGLPRDGGPARLWQAADGRTWVLAEAPLPAERDGGPLLPWRTVVMQDLSAALAPAKALARTMLWVGLSTALLLGLAGFWASRRMLTPWDPIFDAVLTGPGERHRDVAARVQALVNQRRDPTRAELLMGWLARDAGNLRRALDHLPVAIALADKQLRYEYVNPAYTRLLGWTDDTTHGRPIGEPLRDPADHEAWGRVLRELKTQPGEFDSRLDACTPSGERVPVQTHLVPMFDIHGAVVGALSVVYDLRAERSARVRAEALTERLHALADAALDTLLATLDLEGRVLEWSAGAVALSGRPAEEALGRPVNELFGPGCDLPRCLRAAQMDGLCTVAAEGGGRQFEGSLYRLGLTTGVARFGLILRDVSERSAQQRLIETTRDELTQLNRRLLEQEKQTSRQLAQSLHDELGQTLAALRLHWEAWRAARGDRERLETKLDGLVVQANTQVRSVLAELRPPLLDELGLAAALDNELRRHAADAELAATLEVSPDGQVQRWPPDVEYASFMIAREALLNTLHHAGAHRLSIRLDGDDSLLELVVSDDGCGFDTSQGLPLRPGHLGLVGMRERALAIGANLHIRGEPGAGTIVELTWTPPDV